MDANSGNDYGATRGVERASQLPEYMEQEWLMKYLPLVKRIVNQMSFQANQVLDREDMEQIGLMGLLEGLRRYGTPDEAFGGFAVLRVRGAILDELRRQDWRPRLVRQQAHKIRDDIRSLSRQLGRIPRDEEIVEFCGLSSAQYQQHLQADAGEATESLDALLTSGVYDFGGRSANVENSFVDERFLAQVLERLSERERLVLTLYYQHELNLKEIGLVLGVSDVRVCQISKQAIDKACSYLTKRN
jgi:RNA polymerase sigma factor for flagellar operon FliA